MLTFLSESNQNGVVERRFDIAVNGETVPGVIWTPEGAAAPRPLILQGHGGTQHKKTDGIVARARRMARHLGYASVAIDAPGHGERVTDEQRARLREERAVRVAGGNVFTPETLRVMAERNKSAVAEWIATLDAVQGLPEIGVDGPVGYWGVSMGTAIGVPFLAAEPRVKAAVLGLAGLRMGGDEFAQAARSLSIPILFNLQLDDEIVPIESGYALIAAFGSKEKTMHVNPGRHVQIPAFERDAWEAFYVRHLGTAATAPALASV